MNFMTGLQVLGTGLKVMSALKAGQAQQDQAAFDNYQLDLKMNQDKIVARQRMNQRNAQLASNESTNRAMFFSGLNRDASDRSFRAFMEKQKQIAGEDVTQIQGQTVIAASQIGVAKRAKSASAKNAYQSALLGASSAVASGLYAYEEYRTDSGLFDIG